MKALKLVFILVATACAVVACNGPKEPEVVEKTPVTNLIGTWQGCYSTGLVTGGEVIWHDKSNQKIIFTADSIFYLFIDGKVEQEVRFEILDNDTVNFECDRAVSPYSYCGHMGYHFKLDSVWFEYPELLCGGSPVTFVKISDETNF